MNRKFKEIFTNVRVIIFLITLVFAVVAIHPNFAADGVVIRNVLINSSASIAGIENPKTGATPMSWELIKAVNNIPIASEEDYYSVIDGLAPNSTVTVETTKTFYRLQLGVNASLGLSIDKSPTSNLRKGLDLQGGTRVLLQPAEAISGNDMSLLLESLKQRLNVYGLADIIVREASDLTGKQYILIEIAGVNEQEIKELLAKQGKFEAKIGNATIFKGGGQDITYVCRSADCSGIDPRQPCSGDIGNYACRFTFEIALSPDAAERQAAATKKLEIIPSEGGEHYLSESLRLFLDDKEVDELKIAADLKGRAVTEIAISGSGLGRTQEAAIMETLKNMKRLQTILITGSLPVKLDVVQTNNISPFLGKEFLNNALFVGILAIITVSAVVLIRYRQVKIAVPILIICLSEIVLLLGFAALVGWNLDLAGIAGILVSVGTGVNDQIVIADETLSKSLERTLNWKARFKRAFFIIFSAYATLMVAMVPLLFAGAGLLKGFALTTMVGMSIGVFITRPAFANIIQILLKE